MGGLKEVSSVTIHVASRSATHCNFFPVTPRPEHHILHRSKFLILVTGLFKDLIDRKVLRRNPICRQFQDSHSFT